MPIHTITAADSTAPEYLYRQLSNYIAPKSLVPYSQIDAAAIKKLQKIHPPKMDGDLFRGMSVPPELAYKIIQNKPMRLMPKRFPLISWTKSLGTAWVDFAIPGRTLSKGLTVGIVLQVDVPQKDRIVDLTNKRLANNVLRHTHARLKQDVDLALEYEEEVLVKYNPKRVYTLCKNVIMVKIHKSWLNKALNDRENGTIKKKDNEVLEQIVNLKSVMISRSDRVAMFSCDGNGMLTYIPKSKHSSTIKTRSKRRK